MIQRTWRRILPTRLHRQLLLLVLAVLIPSLALLSRTLVEQREDGLELTRQEATRVSDSVVHRQERLVRDTQQLLRTLSNLPEVSEGQADASRRLFSDILLGTPALAYLGALDGDGKRIAVAPQDTLGPDWESAPWFASARRDTILWVGTLGATSPTRYLVCAYPVGGPNRSADLVLFAAIPLERFIRPDFEGEWIEEACLVLLDEDCAVIARHPDCRHPMHAHLAPPDPAEEKAPRCILTTGDDDRQILFSIAPLPVPTDPRLSIGVGLPKDLFAGDTGANMARAFVIMLIVAIIVLFAARQLAFLYILQPLERLLTTARRLRSGDYGARTEVRFPESELGELAQSFDELAATLEQRRADHERALSDLSESEAWHVAVIDAAINGIVTMDLEGRIVRMNSAAEEMFRRHSDQMAGRSVSRLIVQRSACAADESNPEGRGASSFQRFETGRFEATAIRSDQMTFPVEIAVTPIQNVRGRSLVTAYIRDVSRQKEHERALRKLSLVDELTGLHNRRGFVLFAEQQLRTAERMGSWAWLLFADMDDLKEINDNHGHAEGDEALISLAGILRKTFRRADVLSRIGGDEFAILTLDRRRQGAEGMIHRLNKRIDAFNQEAGRAYQLSISIGYAQFDPKSPSSLEELLREGDAMMYEQKRAARRGDSQDLYSVLDETGPPPSPQS